MHIHSYIYEQTHTHRNKQHVRTHTHTNMQNTQTHVNTDNQLSHKEHMKYTCIDNAYTLNVLTVQCRPYTHMDTHTV